MNLNHSKLIKLALVILILQFAYCPVVKYNNPTDAGAVIMQLLDSLKQANQVTSQVTNTFDMREVPTSMDEGTSKTVYIRLAVKSNTTQTITIESSIPALEVNPTTLTFTPDNSTIEQSFTLSALIDTNQVDEIGNITISSSSEVEAKTFGITNKDVAWSSVSLTTDSNVNYGSNSNIKVKLTIKPIETIKIDMTTNYPEVTLNTTQLIFTKDNWNTEQNILLQIDMPSLLLNTNLYSNNQMITITASSNGMTTVSKSMLVDIDKTYTTTTNTNYTGGTASDETITDTVNNLIWQKCNMGQTGTGCSGSRTTANWTNSISYCDTLSLGGNSKWRLPTKSELQTLLNLNAVVFPYTHAIFASYTDIYYWSSTTDVEKTAPGAPKNTFAWFVMGGEVLSGIKDANYFVRCVSVP